MPASLQAQPISAEVLVEKYAKGDEMSVLQVRARVARALAAVEAPEQRGHWEDRFLWAQEKGFVPAGRIASAAGTNLSARARSGGISRLAKNAMNDRRDR